MALVLSIVVATLTAFFNAFFVTFNGETLRELPEQDPALSDRSIRDRR